MWSWPEKKDKDCDGVLSMDLRERGMVLRKCVCWGAATATY